MAAIKKSISLPDVQFAAAQIRWQQLGYTTFSDYLQHLIRQDLGYTTAPAERTVIVHKARASAIPSKSTPHGPSN